MNATASFAKSVPSATSRSAGSKTTAGGSTATGANGSSQSGSDRIVLSFGLLSGLLLFLSVVRL